jgi:hypothetical protein
MLSPRSCPRLNGGLCCPSWREAKEKQAEEVRESMTVGCSIDTKWHAHRHVMTTVWMFLLCKGYSDLPHSSSSYTPLFQS